MDQNEIAVLQLASGQFAIVDKGDYDYVAGYNWNINEEGFISTGSGRMGSLRYLHVLLGPQEEDNCDEAACDFVVHLNRNKLDNRRSNLVLASRSQSNMMRSVRADNKSGAKGVHWDASREKWRATTWKNGKVVYIGRFDKFEDAVAAYDEKITQLYGEFAYTNQMMSK